mgnify:CR=1 FL=1
MGMADPREILARGAELHRDDALGDELGCQRTDRVHAEDAVGRGVGENLDETRRVAQRPRAAVRGKRKAAGAIGDARGLQLLLGLCRPRRSPATCRSPRDGVEVDVAVLARDALGDGDALLLRLVREHGPAHDVADRPDAGADWSGIRSSTATKPRSSSCSPTAAALRPAVCGTRPIDTINRSNVACCGFAAESV